MSGVLAGLTHAGAQAAHARRRAFQRLGVALCADDVARLIAAIRDGDSRRARRLGPAGQGREHWLVKVRGRWAATVWDPTTGQIVTFLPRAPR